MNMEEKNRAVIDAINNGIVEVQDLYQIMGTAYNVGNMNLLEKFKLLQQMENSGKYILAQLQIASGYIGDLIDSKEYLELGLVHAQLLDWMHKAYEDLVKGLRGLRKQVEFDIEKAQCRISGDEFFLGVSPCSDWLRDYGEARKELLKFINYVDEFLAA